MCRPSSLDAADDRADAPLLATSTMRKQQPLVGVSAAAVGALCMSGYVLLGERHVVLHGRDASAFLVRRAFPLISTQF